MTASWCSDGVLQGYVLGSYSARKLGLKTTGNAGGTHNLLVESKNGGRSIDALMRELGTGLLVTELMGQGVNGVTGDYSRGASGYWVEKAWPHIRCTRSPSPEISRTCTATSRRWETTSTCAAACASAAS